MTKNLTKDQYWKLFQKLSNELKTQLLSEETSKNILDICDRYEVEQISQIASTTGDVLMGILRPDEFQETIEQGLELNKNVAKKVAQEINRFIFFPVKKSLEDIYNMEITPPAQIKALKSIKEKSAKRGRKDTYRELVE